MQEALMLETPVTTPQPRRSSKLMTVATGLYYVFALYGAMNVVSVCATGHIVNLGAFSMAGAPQAAPLQRWTPPQMKSTLEETPGRGGLVFNAKATDQGDSPLNLINPFASPPNRGPDDAPRMREPFSGELLVYKQKIKEGLAEREANTMLATAQRAEFDARRKTEKAATQQKLDSMYGKHGRWQDAVEDLDSGGAFGRVFYRR